MKRIQTGIAFGTAILSALLAGVSFGFERGQGLNSHVFGTFGTNYKLLSDSYLLLLGASIMLVIGLNLKNNLLSQVTSWASLLAAVPKLATIIRIKTDVWGSEDEFTQVMRDC